MPPFRIHQTRNKPERILIRLIQGRYIIPQYVAPSPVKTVEAVVEAEPVPEKKKTTISLKQIKQILILLQKSEHKNLSKLLSPELNTLLTLDEDKVDDVEDDDNESELNLDELDQDEEDEEDVLFIDV